MIDFALPYEYEPCTNTPCANGRRTSYAMFHVEPLSVFCRRRTSLSVETFRTKNGRPPTPVVPDGMKFRFWYLMSLTVFDQTKSAVPMKPHASVWSKPTLPRRID